jgi:hypothetical protein
MRRMCAYVALLVSACHSSTTLSPRELDELYVGCQAQLPSDPGAHPIRRSEFVGLRSPADPPGTPVVIYGASWCAACHVAAQYMSRRHIPFVERDVAQDPSARAALLATTEAAGLGPSSRHSLPVMDVRGTVVVGFNPCVLEQAWANP